MKTVFVDTHILIYALEHKRPDALALLEKLLHQDEPGRLVLSEDILFEFAQSRERDTAVALTQACLSLKPLWLRSFADIQAEEALNFVQCASQTLEISRVTAICQSFDEGSDLSRRRGLTPLSFVSAACDPQARVGLADIHTRHSDRLTELTAMVHAGMLTRAKSEEVFTTKVATLLRRGSNLRSGLPESDAIQGAKFCRKHRRRYMRECPSYASEHHLSDYRTSNSRRVARPSDSKDLTLSVAAFPYVDVFVTADGYLFNGLTYVKKALPSLQANLLRFSAGRVA